MRSGPLFCSIGDSLHGLRSWIIPKRFRGSFLRKLCSGGLLDACGASGVFIVYRLRGRDVLGFNRVNGVHELWRGITSSEYGRYGLHGMFCGHLPAKHGGDGVRELLAWPVLRHGRKCMHLLRRWELPAKCRVDGVHKLRCGVLFGGGSDRLLSM